jgi:hypothetical protein
MLFTASIVLSGRSGFQISWVFFLHLHDRFHALVEPAAEAFANLLVKHMEFTRALVSQVVKLPNLLQTLGDIDSAAEHDAWTT